MPEVLDTSHQAKIYVANGLGFHDVGRFGLERLVIPALEHLNAKPKVGIDPKVENLQVIEPFSDQALLKKIDPLFKAIDATDSVKVRREIREKIQRIIGLHNIEHLVGCDAMLFVMDGGHSADDGGSWESGFLAGLDYAKPKEERRPTFHWRSDFTLCESPISGVNCMFHGGAEVSGGRVIEGMNSLPEVIEEVRRWHDSWLKKNNV